MRKELLQNARGMRDFGPAEKIVRDKIIFIMKQVFELFGYNPIEAPAVERYELFASKFGIGAESDAMRETFKLKDQGDRDLVLRTEFTVPFARFVGMNPELKKPFKRYQMGKIFRDGPIKLGRYREFLQCDVDVVGISDPIIDAEILKLTQMIFDRLGLEIVVKINNRKILNRILDVSGIDEKRQASAIITIDKLDKIGIDGVRAELADKGFESNKVDKALQMIQGVGANEELLNNLEASLGKNDGIDEIRAVIDYCPNINIIFRPCLARGLAYYTGNVFEVYLKDQSKISSSVCAGGRFDDMIGGFLEDGETYPAVGISFGLEAIFDAFTLYKKMEFKKSITEVYIITLDRKFLNRAMALDDKLRKVDIKTDMNYLEIKLKKGLEYANFYDIPWTIIIGEEEVKADKVTLRNMVSGEQKQLEIKGIIEEITKQKGLI